MNRCRKCGATSSEASRLIIGFNSCLCGECLDAAKAKHQAVNGNALSTDYEVRLHASPGWQRAHVAELCIWALDDAGAQWHLSWDGDSGATATLDGSWDEIRAHVNARLAAERLTHLQPVRHRDDDAEAHDASAFTIRLLSDGATTKQLRAVARYAGPKALEEGF